MRGMGSCSRVEVCGMADHEAKPLKSILKTGDEPPRHVGGISLAVEEGHDAEKKEHKVGCGEGWKEFRWKKREFGF